MFFKQHNSGFLVQNHLTLLIRSYKLRITLTANVEELSISEGHQCSSNVSVYHFYKSAIVSNNLWCTAATIEVLNVS